MCLLPHCEHQVSLGQLIYADVMVCRACLRVDRNATRLRLESERRLYATTGEQHSSPFAVEREILMEVAGEEVGKMLDDNRQAAKSDLETSLTALRVEIAATDETLRELKTLLASEGARVVDLPGPPLRPRSH
jgi:hypothetical protein